MTVQRRRRTRSLARWFACVVAALASLGCQAESEVARVETQGTPTHVPLVTPTDAAAASGGVSGASTVSIATVTLSGAGSADAFDPVFVELEIGEECVVGIDRFGRARRARSTASRSWTTTPRCDGRCATPPARPWGS